MPRLGTELPKPPTSLIELQAMADAAEMLLTLDAAESFGLVKRKFGVDVDHCRQVLLDAEARGVVPRPGPATDASLLAILKVPEQQPGEERPPTIQRIGNNAISLEIKAQRVFGLIDRSDVRAAVDFRVNSPDRPEHGQKIAQVHISGKELAISLNTRDRHYSIDLGELIKQVAMGDGS